MKFFKKNYTMNFVDEFQIVAREKQKFFLFEVNIRYEL